MEANDGDVSGRMPSSKIIVLRLGIVSLFKLSHGKNPINKCIQVSLELTNGIHRKNMISVSLFLGNKILISSENSFSFTIYENIVSALRFYITIRY